MPDSNSPIFFRCGQDDIDGFFVIELCDQEKIDFARVTGPHGVVRVEC